MNIYYINTSIREGYTCETPTIEFCIEKEELLYNKQCEKPVLCGLYSPTLYEVFCVRDVRGDIEKCNLQRFQTISDAEAYLESVKDGPMSKIVRGYTIKEFTVYDKIMNIPLRHPLRIIRPEELYWQKRQYEDGLLTDDQKLERLIRDRKNILV